MPMDFAISSIDAEAIKVTIRIMPSGRLEANARKTICAIYTIGMTSKLQSGTDRYGLARAISRKTASVTLRVRGLYPIKNSSLSKRVPANMANPKIAVIGKDGNKYSRQPNGSFRYIFIANVNGEIYEISLTPANIAGATR